MLILRFMELTEGTKEFAKIESRKKDLYAGILDISNPLHLHHNDSATLTVVSVKLKGTHNYLIWSYAMLLALEGKNKIGFIDGSCRRYNTDEVLDKQYDRFDALIELPRCTCHIDDELKKHNQLMKLMQFFMGLDDTYMKIKSFILSKDTLLDVRSAYATIFSEESHRVASGSIFKTFENSQTSVFVSNVPNKGHYQRAETSGNAPKPNGTFRPNNVNNNRQSRGSGWPVRIVVLVFIL
nr:ribonuclease H-like domain-containing protein [Tanacetum cinerariifolium]